MQIKQSDPRAAYRRLYFTCVNAAALQTRLQSSDMSTFVVYVSKNGAVPTLSTAAAPTQVDVAHMKGLFYVELPIAEVNTHGRLTVVVTNTGGTANMEPRELDVAIPQSFLATVASGSLTALTTDRPENMVDFFKDSLVEVLSGVNAGQVKKIGGYAVGGVITLVDEQAFTAAFSGGDVVEILSR